ncbi:MAG: hypothetical protein BMS9Abin15_0102 [Gammaproteobacteria bacterium]|nr:MAG: hypothetical protein BMS9Abin15_0102 [Gammaproteobacteria bacterium]
MSRSNAFHPVCLWIKRFSLFVALSTATYVSADDRPLGVSPVSINDQYDHGAPYQGIRLHGALKLSQARLNGQILSELSGLAWDDDEQVLYAISDEASVFHLRPKIVNGRLADVELVAAYPLTDFKGRSLRQPDIDSEGLVLKRSNNGVPGDTELVISFEARPRIQGFTPQGRVFREYPLPGRLNNINVYAARNKALESVVVHPVYGLLTAPEIPLDGTPEAVHTIYALSGLSWRFPRDEKNRLALVDLEVLPDGALLVLLRRYSLLFTHWLIDLKRVELLPGGLTRSTPVARFESGTAWRLDNFEGLAHHRDNFYFMVSDDNGGLLQDTFLVYFEVLDPPGR